MFLEDTQIGPGLKNLLKFKEVGSFQEFFEILKDGKELDIAFVFLYQLLKGNKHLQDKIQDHTEVTLHGFKSLEDVFVFVDDIVKTGAVQERKTTVCVMGNTSAGKSSLVRTLEKYCKDKKAKPEAVLTGDPKNKSLIETKVMELVKDVKLETKSEISLDIEESRVASKFCLIRQSTEEDKEDAKKGDENEEQGENIQMSFVDFAGHSEYVSCSTLFMKKKGIFLICFDTEKLMQATRPIDKGYHPAIGTYFEIVTEKCPTPMFILVATKMDKCNPEDAKEVLDGILETAREHLGSISARSKKLKATFLFHEVIKTSAADEDQLEDTLENLCSILAAVCNHRELMDVRLKTIPTIWKDMIGNLRQHLQVHIVDVEREYQRMLQANQRILDEISHVEERYSASESSQRTKTPLILEGDDLSKWAQMMRDYMETSTRDDQKNVGIEETLQEEPSDKEDRNGTELIREEVRLIDVPTNSTEEKRKSQKKGLFSFGSTAPAKEDSKDEISKSTEETEQDDPKKIVMVAKKIETADRQKVKTILQAFSADHDIFWFRYIHIFK